MNATISDSPNTETKRWKIALLNGLNMTSLGQRDKNVYGTIGSLQELEDLVSATGAKLGVDVVAFHSNHEGDLVDFIEGATDIDAFMINPGGLWRFGEPTNIAFEQAGKPFVEVHFANIYATGDKSVYTDSALATTMGFRHYGYLGSLVALVTELNQGLLCSH